MPNPKRFKFARTRTTSVEEVGPGLLKITCHLVDTLAELKVELTVQLPDLEIVKATGAIERCFDPVERQALEQLPTLAGVRVGPGLTKILKGLMGPETADSQLLFMAEEACHGVILSSTREMSAMMAPNEDDIPADLFRELAKANTRLIGRCAAYDKDSPMVQSILDSE